MNGPQTAAVTGPALPDGPRPNASGPSASAGRPSRVVTAVPAAVALLATAAVTAGLLERRRLTLAALMLAAVITGAVLLRHHIPRLRLESVFKTAVFLLPLAAILGPSAALPGFAQLFAFRLLIAVVAVVGLVWTLIRGRLRVEAPRGIVLLFAAWFAWLGLAMLWAPSKQDAFRYLGLMLLEAVLMAATAFGGSSRRWLRALLATLAVGYGLSLVVAVAEVTTGWHLSSSAASHGGKAKIATGFLYNPNDLATFIAICWPFVLLALVSMRRLRSRLLALAGLGLGAWVVLQTGSRASMIAMGLATVVLPFLMARRGWLKHKLAAGVIVVVAVVSVGALMFNQSDNAVLRQFRVTSFATGVETGQGSGATRLSLMRAGAEVGSTYYFLGVGPGNAEYLVKLQPDAPEDVANLHNWWVEVFVNGGLPAIVIFVILYATLMRTSARVSRQARDPLLQRTAAAVLLALLGYIVGSLGPSTVVSFAPMWILFGLALAVAIGAHREQDGRWTADAAGAGEADATETVLEDGAKEAPAR
jgi:teichuronic acid biosynthesis protein TuaE